jgi:hypothetical protein
VSVGDWCLTFQESVLVVALLVDLCVVKMRPPCYIGTSGINRLVLYSSIQVEEQSSTALLQKFEKSHNCSHLLNIMWRGEVQNTVFPGP